LTVSGAPADTRPSDKPRGTHTQEEHAFLSLVNMLCLIGGCCFLDATALLVILLPVLPPMAECFGIDLVHFGIILLANLGIGYVTPPVGACLFVACSISREPLPRVLRPPGRISS
jgi:C4-dicarboxylate transporter, DctM subunit